MSLDAFANNVAVAVTISRRLLAATADERLRVDIAMIEWRLESALRSIGVEPPRAPVPPKRRKEEVAA